MLRIIFVAAIIILGAFYSLQGPFYALLFYLWNAYFRPEDWLWTDALYGARLSLLIYVFMVASSLTAFQRFRFTGQIGLILLFVLQSLISVLASDYFGNASTYLIEFAKVIGIVLLITFLVSDERRFRLALLVIGYSLGFEAAKQGWVTLMLNPGATNANLHPFLGDNNGVALGMFMVIPIFGALAVTSVKKWERWVHRFFIVGLTYRGITTYSRGGFLAGGVLAMMTVWRSKRRVRMAIVVAVLATVVLASMPERFWDRMDTITASEDERDSSAAGRLHYWRVAEIMARQNPLTGVGFNSFKNAYDAYEFEQGWGYGRAAHSAWFGTLGELGYPGLLLFISILALALNSCRRVRKAAVAQGAANMAAYATAMQSSLIVYIVGGTFLSAQYSEMYWHFIGLTIALERIHKERSTQSVPEPARIPGPLRAGRVAAI